MNYNKNNKMSKISSVSELAKEDLKEINGGMPLIAIAAYGTALMLGCDLITIAAYLGYKANRK